MRIERSGTVVLILSDRQTERARGGGRLFAPICSLLGSSLHVSKLRSRTGTKNGIAKLADFLRASGALTKTGVPRATGVAPLFSDEPSDDEGEEEEEEEGEA